MQQRQHLKDRNHHSGTMPQNPDIHVLQHTINVDTMPDNQSGVAGARRIQGYYGQPGALHSSHYDQQKTSSYQPNLTSSIQGSDQLKHQRPHQRPYDFGVSTSAGQPSNDLHQVSLHGRDLSDNKIPRRISNMSGSGVLQTSNGGGTQDIPSSLHDRRMHQKPHRPGKFRANSKV